MSIAILFSALIVTYIVITYFEIFLTNQYPTVTQPTFNVLKTFHSKDGILLISFWNLWSNSLMARAFKSTLSFRSGSTVLRQLTQLTERDSKVFLFIIKPRSCETRFFWQEEMTTPCKIYKQCAWWLKLYGSLRMSVMSV